jgi:hypothetical protein
MQNRYVADIGDYGKYGLLRNIARTGYRLGVNWYLAPDECHNANGMHVAYLDKGQLYNIDVALFSALKEIKDNGIRDVRYVQEAGILPDNTIYYNRVLDASSGSSSPARQSIRRTWHEGALNSLKECDVVFLDPDIGLEVQSVSLTSKEGNKHIGICELKDYIKAGKSIIFYNHRARKQEEDYLNKFRKLKNDDVFSGCSWLGLKFVRGTVRDYIFITQPQHAANIQYQFNLFLKSKWALVFSEISL